MFAFFGRWSSPTEQSEQEGTKKKERERGIAVTMATEQRGGLIDGVHL